MIFISAAFVFVGLVYIADSIDNLTKTIKDIDRRRSSLEKESNQP